MSIRGCNTLLRTMNLEKACKSEFKQLHSDKDVQIGNVHCRLSRRLCLSIRGHDPEGFFWCSKWFLFSTNEFVLTYHVNIWAAVHNDLPFFVVTISPRCDNLLLNVSVRWPEEIFICLEKTSTLYHACANPKHSCEQIPNVCTTFEPLIRHNIGMSSFTTLRRREFLSIPNTTCGKRPFFFKLSDVTSSRAWVTSNVLATTTELFGFFRSHPAHSECLNTHQMPIVQSSFLMRRILWWMPIFANITPCWQSHSLKANHVDVFFHADNLVPFKGPVPKTWPRLLQRQKHPSFFSLM